MENHVWIWTAIIIWRNILQYLIGNGLMKLEKPMKLTEYVKTIFLPSSVPLGTNCQIHGTHNEEFNHAIITRMTSKCNHTGMLFSRKKCYNVYIGICLFFVIVFLGDDNFYLCTEQESPSGECLSNWSGSLVNAISRRKNKTW